MMSAVAVGAAPDRDLDKATAAPAAPTANTRTTVGSVTKKPRARAAATPKALTAIDTSVGGAA